MGAGRLNDPTASANADQGFRARILRRETILGTFIKTPSRVVCDVLALSPLDCFCIDAEHAPFDRGDIDACVAAFRAAGKPALVRVPVAEPHHILNALDSGADGVVLPHVSSAAAAIAGARAARFGPGGRGYAGSTRAAHFTTRAMSDHLKASNESVVVIAQIEDAEALPLLDTIAAVEGIDVLFVGRMDLTVSLGAATPNDAVVIEAVERIVDAGQRAGRAVGMFVPNVEEARRWTLRGVSFFLLGSDQTFLLEGARRLSSEFRN